MVYAVDWKTGQIKSTDLSSSLSHVLAYFYYEDQTLPNNYLYIPTEITIHIYLNNLKNINYIINGM